MGSGTRRGHHTRDTGHPRADHDLLSLARRPDHHTAERARERSSSLIRRACAPAVHKHQIHLIGATLLIDEDTEHYRAYRSGVQEHMTALGHAA